jgi:carbon monoxide dehydrogenase subunit G
MAHYRAQLDVRRPIDEVFAYLADFSNTQEWDPGVVSAKRRGDGPVAVGTRFAVVAKFFGQELALDYQIVQYDPPSRVVLEAENDNLRSVDTITFEKTGRGTRLTYDANLTLKGIRYLGDLALHLAFQWIGRRALEGLRAALHTRRAS